MRYFASKITTAFLTFIGLLVLSPLTHAHELVSVSTSGEQGNDISGDIWPYGGGFDDVGGYAINADGRYIVFNSWASNLVEGDTNRDTDIFLRDTQRRTTIRLTTAPGGQWDIYGFHSLDISDDGRTVVYVIARFMASPNNPNAFNGLPGTVAIHDRDPDENGIFDEIAPEFMPTVELSQARIGEGEGIQEVSAKRAYISGNGRYVVFSGSWPLEDPFHGFQYGIFIHDRDTDENDVFDEVGQVDTFLVEDIPNGLTRYYAQPRLTGISRDGTFILYDDRVGPGEIGNDVFVYNRSQQTNTLISKTLSGQPSQKSQNGSINPDGRFVAFESSSPELVEENIYDKNQIFSHDRDPDENGILDDTPAATIATKLVSYHTSGLVSLTHVYNPRINDRGNIVVFDTEGSLDWQEDNNNTTDIYINYNGNHSSSLVSRGLNGGANGESRYPQIDDRADKIVFSSNASDLVINDINRKRDVFVTTRGEGHSVCNLTTQQCVMVAGAGDNECLTNSECTQSYQTCTLNGQCVWVAGIPLPGTPSCSSDVDCAEIIDPPCLEEEGCFRQSCVDSDGGIEYGSSGGVEFSIDNEIAQTATDQCCNQGAFLKEYYCNQGAIRHRWFFCKLCDHGACLETDGYSVQAIPTGDHLNSCGEIRDFYFPNEDQGMSNARPRRIKSWMKRLWKLFKHFKV